MAAAKQRIKDLYGDAMELPEEQRVAFVSMVAGDDAELRASVLDLLDASRSAGALLAEAKGTAMGKLAASAAAATGRSIEEFGTPLEGPGTVLGRYTLLNVLGEGGFGVVYRAEQREPVRRHVALKILKPGMDTRAVVTRFRGEQEALALMNHPGIAKVLDAGSTPTGRPYVVMELVTGWSPGGEATDPDQTAGAASAAAYAAGVVTGSAEVITAYCDRCRLTVQQRVHLAIDVCRALQHAHSKGVIHRDIKPSNVLVAEVDGRPMPKMIDFGIAKAVRPGLMGGAMTEQWQMLGTPEHMAPEQLDNAGSSDVRTDVYGVGTLLYELLCGVTPFDAAMLRSLSLERLREAVVTTDPPPPSVRLGQLTEPGVIAGRRQTTAAGLRTQLRGELDWIVTRCLEKEPQRRYQTAAALADDLQRWMEHRPVEAMPPTRWYALRKWLRRHRGLAAAVTAVSAAVMTGLVATGIALYEASQERSAAIRSASEAQRQAGRAELVTRFLLDDMLGSLQPESRRGKDVTVREIAQTATERMYERFSANDQTRVSVQLALADVWRKIGDTNRARELYAETLELAEKLLGPGSQALVPILLGYASTLESDGNHTLQMTLTRRAMNIAEATLAPGDPLRSAAVLAVARSMRYTSSLEDAEAMLDRLPPLESDETALGVEALAVKADLLRGSPERVPLLERALARSQSLNDNNRLRDHDLRFRLVLALTETGRPAEAERLAREDLALSERLFPPDSLQAAEGRRALMEVLAAQGRMEEAAAEAVRAADVNTAALGEESLGARSIALRAAELASRGGLHEDAVRLGGRVLELEQLIGGAGADYSLNAARSYVRILLSAGRATEAVRIGAESVRAADGTGSAFRIGLRRAYGDALVATGQSEAAETVFAESVNISLSVLGETSPRIAEVLQHAQRSLAGSNRPDLAARYETLDAFRASRPR
jgi:serine/threonine protein kinase